MELIEGAGEPFEEEAFQRGELSPIFWGSAMTNFGIEPLLNFLADKASSPKPRTTTEDELIKPDHNKLTREIRGFGWTVVEEGRVKSSFLHFVPVNLQD